MKKSYGAIAGDLKKLGLISYDLRKSLNRGQKAQITKLSHQYGEVLSHPEHFHIPRVGKDTGKALKKAGFTVTKTGRAIVPLSDGLGGHYDKAQIERGKIKFKGTDRSEDVFLASGPQFFRELKRITSKKLPRNVLISARIGQSGTFSRSRFSSYADLYKYLSEDFEPKDPGESKQRVLSLMSLVYIHEKEQPKTRRKSRGKKKGYNDRRN